MSKHIVRSIVAVLILSMVGYIVWYFFLQTKKEDYVGANTVAVVEKIFDKNNGVNAKITSVDKASMAGANYAEISLSSNAEVAFVRSKAASWNVVTNILSEMTKYYYSYSLYATSLTDSQKQEFDSLKSQVINSANSLIENIDNLLYYQKNNYKTSDDTSVKILAEYYADMVVNRIAYINDLNNFNVFLRDYVISSAYNNSFVYDFKNIYYNTILNTIPNIVTMSTTNKLATWVNIYNKTSNSYAEGFANNVLAQGFVSKLVNSYKNKSFTDEATAEKVFLNLSQNYKQIVFGPTSVFRFNHEDIVKIAKEEYTDKTTTITLKYLPDVVQLLNILGYN